MYSRKTRRAKPKRARSPGRETPHTPDHATAARIQTRDESPRVAAAPRRKTSPGAHRVAHNLARPATLDGARMARTIGHRAERRRGDRTDSSPRATRFDREAVLVRRIGSAAEHHVRSVEIGVSAQLQVGATDAYPEVVADKRTSSLGEFIRRQRELSEVSMRQFARAGRDLESVSVPDRARVAGSFRAGVASDRRCVCRCPRTRSTIRRGCRARKTDRRRWSRRSGRIRKLTGRQRQALIEVYEAFVGVGARPRRS